MIFDFLLNPNVATVLIELNKSRLNLSIEVYSVYLKSHLPEGISSKEIKRIIDLLHKFKLLDYNHKDDKVMTTPDGSFIAGLLGRIRRECEDIEELLGLS